MMVNSDLWMEWTNGKWLCHSLAAFLVSERRTGHTTSNDSIDQGKSEYIGICQRHCESTSV